MSRGRRWFLVTLCLTAISSFCVIVLFPRQPGYDGRHISYWFEEYYQKREARRDCSHAEEAFEAMGTNAIPYLIKQAMACAPESPARKAYYELLETIRGSTSKSSYVSESEIEQHAIYLIGRLKAPAGLLLEHVSEAVRAPDKLRRNRALVILSGAGSEKEKLVPLLTQLLRDSDRGVQMHSAILLEGIGTAAGGAAVPNLLQLIRTWDRTNDLHRQAVYTLACMRSNAAPAAEVIRSCFYEETNWWLRCDYAAALWCVGLQEPAALQFLSTGIQKTQDLSRIYWSMSRLRLIGGDAKPAIPALLAAIEFGERDVWIRAVAAAGDLGATPEQLLPRLRQKLTLDEESRVTAATRILSMHPADAESQSVLVREIGKDPRSEWSAIFALGRAGTNAKNAIVPIMSAFDGTNVSSWTSAADALRSMGALEETYLPRLREKLSLGAEFDRLLVAKKLLEIDPQDRGALNAVLDIVRRPSKYQRYAVDILADVGPAARHAIPILQQVLRDGDEGIQFAAKRALRIIKGSKLPPSPG